MKRMIFLITVLLASIGGMFAQGVQPSTTTQPKPVPTPFSIKLKVGDIAPDFTLPATDGTKVKLSDFRGKSNVVLAFYVFAFTGG